ncbi:MAG: hypothetical protein WCK05_11305, partial [Planctomycetota bacterium]
MPFSDILANIRSASSDVSAPTTCASRPTRHAADISSAARLSASFLPAVALAELAASRSTRLRSFRILRLSDERASAPLAHAGSFTRLAFLRSFWYSRSRVSLQAERPQIFWLSTLRRSG